MGRLVPSGVAAHWQSVYGHTTVMGPEPRRVIPVTSQRGTGAAVEVAKESLLGLQEEKAGTEGPVLASDVSWNGEPSRGS